MKNALDTLLTLALQEDCPSGDCTVRALFTTTSPAHASLYAKESGVFFGCELTKRLVAHCTPTPAVDFSVTDGAAINAGDALLTLTGTHSSLLQIERPLLNFLQRLCGIATQTRRFIRALNNPHIALCDTRKTTPGFRLLEKEAVRAGGGTNHRTSLSDMILVKENHLQVLKNTQQLATLADRIGQAKAANPTLKAELEIETLAQLQDLPLGCFDYLLFDNMPLAPLQEASRLARQQAPHAQLEVSGAVTLATIGSYATLDIDRISVGALTHSVPALDLSLLIHA